MKKVALIISVLLTSLAGLAQAQVAAPSLLPAQPTIISTGFLTDNPAVMQWGKPSRVGLGRIEYEFNDYETTTGALTSTNTLDGFFAGIRMVGESFSFALEGSQLDGDLSGGFSVEVSITGFGGSLQVGDAVALGLGKNLLESEVSSAGVTATTELDLQLAGFSLRLFEVFFIGAAMGTEKTTIEFLGTSDSLSVDLSRYGIGIMTEGETRWHLEYNEIKSDYGQSAGVLSSQETDQSTFVAEVGFGPFVVGLRAGRIDMTDTAIPQTDSADFARVGVAWAPEKGLGVAAHYTQYEIVAGTIRTEEEEKSFSFYLMF